MALFPSEVASRAAHVVIGRAIRVGRFEVNDEDLAHVIAYSKQPECMAALLCLAIGKPLAAMEARLMAQISIQDTELAAIQDALGHVSADYATLRTGITTLLAEAQANAETDTTKAAIAAIIASANTLDGNIQTDGALANASPAVQAVAQAAAPQTPVADPNAPSSGSAATAASSGSGAGQVGSSAGQAETTQPAGGPSTDASNPGGGPAGQ